MKICPKIKGLKGFQKPCLSLTIEGKVASKGYFYVYGKKSYCSTSALGQDLDIATEAEAASSK